VLLTDRGRKPKENGKRLDPADFEASPYAGSSRRKHARSRIETPHSPSLDPEWGSDPPPPEPPKARRLSRSERRQIQERRRATATGTVPVRRPVRKPKQNRWGMKLGGIIALSFIVIMLGSERFFGVNGEGNGLPTATIAPLIAMEPSPSPTKATEVVVIFSPSTPTPSPTPSPTPDPRFVGKVVCLDPGHGGGDRGYTRDTDGAAPEMEEAVLNLAHAQALKQRLEARGFTVVMTRDADVDVNVTGEDVNGDGKVGRDSEPAGLIDELQARINVCNRAHADLLVSMHINGFPDSTVSGYETWYNASRPFKDKNKLFAQLVFDAIGHHMRLAGYNATPRQVNDDAKAHVDIGHDAFDSYVITGPAHAGQIVPSSMPGAIVETLFISNDDDAAFMATDEGNDAIVSAYEDAIVEYFEQTNS
jgi:N-acetylmuramoyl-L-alanine amidase